MPIMKRFKTAYPGVYYIVGTSVIGKPERIYYVRYSRDGKSIDEKAGRQFRDAMTPAAAALVRARRVHGEVLSNKERREQERQKVWTFDNLWEHYAAANSHLKGLSVDQDRYNRYVRPTVGKKTPEALIPLDTERIRVNLLKTLSPGTVRHALEVVRRLSNYAEKVQLCRGLVYKITMPRLDNEKTEDLTPAQLTRLLEVLDAWPCPVVPNMMRLALFTGMRRGEIFKLRWDDLDFERGFIRIRDPKGGKSETIPMGSMARGVLEGCHRGRNRYVFPGKDGGIRTSVGPAPPRIRDKAGLPKSFRPFHGLRHVFASRLASSGKVDLYTLQRLLTHKNPRMTQRYAHLSDERLKEAAEVIGEAIDGDGGKTSRQSKGA